jgi:carboxypeptidase PM20D1
MNRSIQALQDALSFPTISYSQRSLMDSSVFHGFVERLSFHYPKIFTKAHITSFHTHTLLFHLKGKDNTLPIALMGHYDVVPVSNTWSVLPFSGHIQDSYIYGRGALDMKGHLIAVFEAIERLLEQDYEFNQDLYIMMGHNEETGSDEADSGAEAMMNHLKSLGIKLHLVIDEGGNYISKEQLHVNQDLTLIGIGEKGYMDVRAIVNDQGGHSSTPPKKSALVEPMKLGVYVETHKFKPVLNSATEAMFKACAPFASFPHNIFYKYPKLFKWFILHDCLKDPKLAAHFRTTAVMTMVSGASSMNVLPQVGLVNLNVRIAPHQTSQDVIEAFNKVKGSKVRLDVDFANEPTSISRLDDGVFEEVVGCLQSIYPDMSLVVPSLMVAATDARYMHEISDHVFRCCPFDSMKEDRHTVHADDERLSLISFEKGIEFFISIITKFA